MIKHFYATVLLLIMSVPVSADPFRPVQHFFAAASAGDFNRLRNVVTDDYELLEVGELWDLEKLISVIPEGGMDRRNFFSRISTRIEGNMAWVSYWNHAIINRDGATIERAWLESAVMVKTASGWKMQMLHSTRIKPEDFPAGVEFEEYRED